MPVPIAPPNSRCNPPPSSGTPRPRRLFLPDAFAQDLLLSSLTRVAVSLAFHKPSAARECARRAACILQTPVFILWLEGQCVFTVTVGHGLESVCKFGFVTKYAGEQKPCSLFVEVPGMLLFNNLPSQCSASQHRACPETSTHQHRGRRSKLLTG